MSEFMEMISNFVSAACETSPQRGVFRNTALL